MRNEYRNRLDMNKTGRNAIRLKLTNLQPALKTCRQKPGARFAVVGTRTVEPKLKFRALDPAPGIPNFSLWLQNDFVH